LTAGAIVDPLGQTNSREENLVQDTPFVCRSPHLPQYWVMRCHRLLKTIIDEWAAVKGAPFHRPELKSVTLDPKTTAILVVDMIKQTCNEQRRPALRRRHSEDWKKLLASATGRAAPP